eukprot:COSAG06_NODE_7236_length_2577_cov_1.755448_4_plen_124_part_00
MKKDAFSAGTAELAACDGSAQQQWTVKKHDSDDDSDDKADAAASYQIVSSTGQCIADVSKPQANSTTTDAGSGSIMAKGAVAAAAADAAALVFDVKASLGWQNGAKVRDLWAKKDLVRDSRME